MTPALPHSRRSWASVDQVDDGTAQLALRQEWKLSVPGDHGDHSRAFHHLTPGHTRPAWVVTIGRSPFEDIYTVLRPDVHAK